MGVVRSGRSEGSEWSREAVWKSGKGRESSGRGAKGSTQVDSTGTVVELKVRQPLCCSSSHRRTESSRKTVHSRNRIMKQEAMGRLAGIRVMARDRFRLGRSLEARSKAIRESERPFSAGLKGGAKSVPCRGRGVVTAPWSALDRGERRTMECEMLEREGSGGGEGWSREGKWPLSRLELDLFARSVR